MQKHYSHNTSFTDFNGTSLPLHSPRQSTINAILQYAEIYPVKGMQYDGNLTYLYDLKN